MKSFIEPEVFLKYLQRAKTRKIQPYLIEGRLTGMVGLTLEVKGCRSPVGSRFAVQTEYGNSIEAEVVGFKDDVAYLMPLQHSQGLVSGARVIPLAKSNFIKAGKQLMGRVVDSNNAPIDNKEAMFLQENYPIYGRKINPLNRGLVDENLDVGVRAINALLTIGKGQRIGLFAGAGCGKSALLGMMTKATQADVVVVALIGERGREVREFTEQILGIKKHEKTVVVASPADDPPLLRYQGALTAMANAEYFRDQGKDVLLIMDSLTRFAQAQREIGLSAGEMPASKGYPPSVFTKIPRLAERAGKLASGGSITSIYTILTEENDMDDPVADCAKATLDGHIVLDKSLVEQGIYPAIDILKSTSRTMLKITTKEHQEKAAVFKKYYAQYIENQDFIKMGAYKEGVKLEVDTAIRMFSSLQAFIEQHQDEPCSYEDSKRELFALFDDRSIS